MERKTNEHHQDVAEFQAISKLIVGSVPNAKLKIMTEVAHLPSKEKSEEFNRVVLEFLK